MEFLCEFYFEIKHIKGKVNNVADALSRRVHDMRVSTISMYKSNLKRRILRDFIRYVYYLHIKQELQ